MAQYSQVCSNVGSFTWAERFTLYVELNDRDGNPTTNESIVDYNVYFQNTSGGGRFNSLTRLYFSINNEVKRDETPTVEGPRNGSVSIASGSITVKHNDDGKKEIPFQALVQSVNLGISANIQGNFALTTIPRASSITCSNANIGSNPTINIKSASSSFKHSLYCSFYDLNIEAGKNLGGGNYSGWTIPDSFYEKIPNQASAWATMYCNTHDANGNMIGQTLTTFTITTNRDLCKPIVTGSVEDTNEKTIALTGSKTTIVKNASTLLATINAQSQKSASIKSKSVNGVAISGTQVNLGKSSSATFNFTATDSRGYDNSYTYTPPKTIDYIPLSINAKFFRPQPTTGEISLTYSGNYFNGNFGTTDNSLSIIWKYKERTSEEWIDGGVLTPEIEDNKIKQMTVSLGTVFNYQSSWDIQLIAEDELNIVVVSATVTMGMPVFYWGKDFFTVNTKAIMPTVRTKLENVNGRIDDANVVHTNENDRAHLQLLQATVNMTANKPASDGYILHFSWDTNLGYDSQIFIGNNPETGGRIQCRSANAGVWSGWDSLYKATSLFENSSGNSGTITLNDSVANYDMVEVFFFDWSNGQPYQSVRIYNPNGKIAAAQVLSQDGTNIRINVVKLYFSGNTITQQYGQVNYQPSGGTWSVLEQSIYKVIGYR